MLSAEGLSHSRCQCPRAGGFSVGAVEKLSGRRRLLRTRAGAFEALKPMPAAALAMMAELLRRTSRISPSLRDELTAGRRWDGPADDRRV